ncbi:hypothetical protein [Sciscionella sediminilitoris]|uniref:hypothetical protein n=1 Tax=Sciscionella sediminilitoris TaxID=1445613 RepID=UPI0004DF840D|nr:hypothetical protein [Sciscionella sp. SE31]
MRCAASGLTIAPATATGIGNGSANTGIGESLDDNGNISRASGVPVHGPIAEAIASPARIVDRKVART